MSLHTRSNIAESFVPQTMRIESREIVIRSMGWEHAQAVSDFAQALGDEDRLLLRMDLSERGSISDWVESIDLGQRATLLAIEGGKVLGYTSLSLRGLNWFRHLADFRVVVEPGSRGLGIGRRLGTSAISLADGLGLYRLVAQVPRPQIRAQTFFEHLGFRPRGLLPDWVMDARGELVDLALLTRDLDSEPNSRGRGESDVESAS